MNKPRIAAVVFAVVCLGSARARPKPSSSARRRRLRPAENIEGFTVAGKAYSSAKPNSVEIDLDVSASSELTADAIVKYRDAKKRMHDAFAALKLKNVGHRGAGAAGRPEGNDAEPVYVWGGMPNTRTKTEVQLSRKLVVKASDIRSMEEDAVLQLVGKLLDVAQDSGGRIGGQNDWNPYYYNPYQNMPRGLVRFVLEDLDKLQDEAYDKAIADARVRAERLAQLEQRRARADDGGARDRRAVRPVHHQRRRDAEAPPRSRPVPGDSDSRRAASAIRDSLQGRQEITECKSIWLNLFGISTNGGGWPMGDGMHPPLPPLVRGERE